jgi:hypothetical protein
VITRRKFLFDCSTTVATLALLPVKSFSIPARSEGRFRSLDEISYPALANQINTLFRVRLSPLRTVELKLLKAPRAPSTPMTPGRRLPWDAGNEKFSLIFSGPKAELIDPAIHRFEHGELGQFDMYIGQIGRHDTDSLRYETVFNRRPITATTLKELARKI